MGAICRILRPEDCLNYREIRLESLRVSPDSFGASYENEVETPKLRFEKLIEQESSEALMLGAFVDEKLVGLCGLLSSHPEPVKIVQMYVKSDYQGQGIAHQLLDLAKQCIKNLNSNSLKLSVFEGNQRAINAYEKAGFIPIKIEKNEVHMIFNQQT